MSHAYHASVPGVTLFLAFRPSEKGTQIYLQNLYSGKNWKEKLSSDKRGKSTQRACV